MVAEAEKSCSLLSVSQRNRKVGGMIQSESKCWRILGQWFNSQSKSEGPRTRVLMSKGRRR